MKDIINYYYNFDITNIIESKNTCSFTYNGDMYFFSFYSRSLEELKDIISIINELKNKGIRVHDIIKNKDNEYITKVSQVNYVLLKINQLYNDRVSFNEVIDFTNKLKLTPKVSKLYRNNWAYLWSKKIDYFEYQIKELGKDKSIILDSFSYYIGLAENAISYVNKTNRLYTNDGNITLSHRRIFNPNIVLNYYNPLSFIFDLEVRDIAEYIKSNYSNLEEAYLDLEEYLKIKKLSVYEYHMLYARLLYPSFYFDIYEDIMNNNTKEEIILPIIDRIDLYEEFLNKAYLEISKYAPIEQIEWLIKKES